MVKYETMLRSVFKTGTRTKSLATALRKSMPRTERKLWTKLRNKRFYGFCFRRQTPLEPYIVDFLCVEKKLIVEIDGPTHGFMNAEIHDLERDHYFELKGYRTLRFGNHQIWKAFNLVLYKIALALMPENKNRLMDDFSSM